MPEQNDSADIDRCRKCGALTTQGVDHYEWCPDSGELPGMWERSDLLNGDPDPRSYAEREAYQLRRAAVREVQAAVTDAARERGFPVEFIERLHHHIEECGMAGFAEQERMAQEAAELEMQIMQANEEIDKLRYENNLLVGFVLDVREALEPSRGIPPDVWGATKDEVIDDIAVALNEFDEKSPKHTTNARKSDGDDHTGTT